MRCERLNDLLIIQNLSLSFSVERKNKRWGRETTMSEKDSVREQIVEAAKKRFSHFGYAKTTMAEVAGDCAMSPGNLYRFFPGKLDIAEAIATEDYSKHLDHLRKLAVAPEKDARTRLHDLLFEELRRTYHKLEKDPRAYEMARVISTERPKFANWMLENERKILVDLLEEAERRGEFSIADKAFTAEMVQAATMKFRYPQLWSKLTLPKLERELEGVMNLLIDGLCTREAALRSANQDAAA
ncbi:MAG TPA: TetR/AcrR family transcriptional regulator [Rhizomicrobium sp.]|nr:TetR/AcrR family transcriptional regulator [Rhizomicrobium sp.]